MQEDRPYSPEGRRHLASVAKHTVSGGLAKVRPGTYPFVVAKRVVLGVFDDGFIHAGNLAYLALVTLFPFFIVAAAIARLFGRTEDGLSAVNAFLLTVPPRVAEVLDKPINDVLHARTGSLLWLGAIVGLWTTGSFIESIRDILRRAYGVKYSRPFWEYRLASIGIIIVSVMLVMLAFSMQVLLVGLDQFVREFFPFTGAIGLLSISRLAPAFAMFAAFYMIFALLTPGAYRGAGCPKWPGALLVTIWWLGVTELLPLALGGATNYDLTYGSLAGVMIALIFFYLVGFGVVIGAELNAALAETPATAGEEKHAATEDVMEEL